MATLPMLCVWRRLSVGQFGLFFAVVHWCITEDYQRRANRVSPDIFLTFYRLDVTPSVWHELSHLQGPTGSNRHLGLRRLQPENTEGGSLDAGGAEIPPEVLFCRFTFTNCRSEQCWLLLCCAWIPNWNQRRSTSLEDHPLLSTAFNKSHVLLVEPCDDVIWWRNKLIKTQHV